MAEIINFLRCPITNTDIDIGLCQDIQFVVDDAIIEDAIDFKLTESNKNTCRNCKKRIDPTL